MPKNSKGRERSRFSRWFHRTFDDWLFRSIGPAQVDNAVDGAEQEAREEWKRDLELRKRSTRERRERKRLAREAQRAN